MTFANHRSIAASLDQNNGNIDKNLDKNLSAMSTEAAPGMEVEDSVSNLFTPEFWQEQLQWLLQIAVNAGLALVFALIILLIGWIIIKIIIWYALHCMFQY